MSYGVDRRVWFFVGFVVVFGSALLLCSVLVGMLGFMVPHYLRSW